MSYSAEQTYVSSATSAHEFKISSLLHYWRWLALCVFFMIMVLIVKMYLYCPEYKVTADAINASLANINDLVIRKQQTVTMALKHILPPGVKGMFCAIMLVALISTYDSFLHTFGAVFIQDIIMPFRKKPFSKKTHFFLLRMAILAIAIFAIIASYLYKPTGSILMAFALINALWLAPSGIIIIGGLYWKRGTTQGAFATLMTGLLIFIAGFIAYQVESLKLSEYMSKQTYFFFSIIACSIVFIAVSLMKDFQFNLNKMLHRAPGKQKEKMNFNLIVFGITKEFNIRDKVITYSIIGYYIILSCIVIIGSFIGKNISNESWFHFWAGYLIFNTLLSVVVTVWFIIGGFIDLKNMLHNLKVMERNDNDQGFVDHDQVEIASIETMEEQTNDSIV